MLRKIKKIFNFIYGTSCKNIPEHHRKKLLIIDCAPNLLYKEIYDFLNHNLDITVNINKISEKAGLQKEFGNKICYTNFNSLDKEALIKELLKGEIGYDAIKTRHNTIIDKEIISAAVLSKIRHRLKVIAQTGIGINNIDCDAATKLGVFVTNTPGSNSNAVAELVISQMITLARNVFYHNNELHSGRWSRDQVGLNHFELRNKILGIIGVGNIANNLIIKAHALGMKIITYSLLSKRNEFNHPFITKFFDFKEFFSKADFISVHTPLTNNTKNLISFKELRWMKKGSFLINTSRGGVINEVALAKELKRKNRNIAGAALDVHEKEGTEYISLFMGMSNVLLTPHIGGVTSEALITASECLSANVNSILNKNYNVPIINKELVQILNNNTAI